MTKLLVCGKKDCPMPIHGCISPLNGNKRRYCDLCKESQGICSIKNSNAIKIISDCYRCA